MYTNVGLHDRLFSLQHQHSYNYFKSRTSELRLQIHKHCLVILNKLYSWKFSWLTSARWDFVYVYGAMNLHSCSFNSSTSVKPFMESVDTRLSLLRSYRSKLITDRASALWYDDFWQGQRSVIEIFIPCGRRKTYTVEIIKNKFVRVFTVNKNVILK